MTNSFFLHATADVSTEKIGKGTRLWQFCVVGEGVSIGADCNVCSHCFIESGVRIGDRVTVKNGVQLWAGVQIENDVFVGPNVSFTNDRFPRSRKPPSKFDTTILKSGCSVGAGAVILPGLTIGQDAMVAAGAVVTQSVPPGAVVVGNPARITRYIDTDRKTNGPKAIARNTDNLTITGAEWVRLRNVTDMRGHLTVAQWNDSLPFAPRRVFFVHHVPSSRVRGEHAHKTCHQLLAAVSGHVRVVLDDGSQRCEIQLDSPERALLIPAGVWATQYGYSSDAVMCVFASEDYDEDDYIRDYDTFLKFRRDTIS